MKATNGRLTRLRAFLLDMDGTIYLGEEPIEGASRFIAYLRASGRRFMFFTNNPTASAEQYCGKLRSMGMDAEPGEVLTSGEATAAYIEGETPYRKLLTVGPPSFEEALRQAGFTLVEDQPDAVVLSFDTSLTHEKLCRAHHWLCRGVPYIATNPDRVCPTRTGSVPDCGSIAALLEASSGRTPVYVGKPHPTMARMALARLNAEPRETAMVGDRLYTDMAMARSAGLTAILVLSGETQPEMVVENGERPDYVFPSVNELRMALEQG